MQRCIRQATAWLALLCCAPVLAEDAPVVAAPAASSAPAWQLHLPKSPALTYHGMVNFDSVGLGTGQVLYAGGLIGLVVGVAAHSALIAGAKDSQKQHLQDTADAVLIPYRKSLDGIDAPTLFTLLGAEIAPEGIGLVASDAADAAGTGAIQIEPVFVFTQDQRAIVMDADVRFTSSANAKPIDFLVRIVGDPVLTDEPVKFWNNADGAALRSQMERLLSRALHMTLALVAQPGQAGDLKYETVRFSEGQLERMERGAVFSIDCDRVSMRNLRGTYFSVPVKVNASVRPAGCPAPALGEPLLSTTPSAAQGSAPTLVPVSARAQ